MAKGTASAGDAVYRALIEAELDDQDSRKSSFEARAMAVVSTSGTLVTLLFGLASLVTADESFELSSSARCWLQVAVGLFLCAAVLALGVGLPWRVYGYAPVDEADVKSRLEDNKLRSELDAHRDIAFAQINALEAAKAANSRKGRVLFSAVAVECAAIVAVGVAIFKVL